MFPGFGEYEHLPAHLLLFAFKCQCPELQPHRTFAARADLCRRPSESVPRAADSSSRPRGFGWSREAPVEGPATTARSSQAGKNPGSAFQPANVHSAAKTAPPARLCWNPRQTPPPAQAHFPPRMPQNPALARLPAAASRRAPCSLETCQEEATEETLKAGTNCQGRCVWRGRGGGVLSRWRMRPGGGRTA